MIPSPEARASAERLVAAVGALAAELELAGDRFAEVAATVRRYRDLAADELAASDVATALRGANLLTTVKKDAGDAKRSPQDEALSVRAFDVANEATGTAALLRADAGVGW